MSNSSADIFYEREDDLDRYLSLHHFMEPPSFSHHLAEGLLARGDNQSIPQDNGRQISLEEPLSPTRQHKSRPIKKDHESRKKKPSRRTREKPMGRPTNNTVEEEHLEQNRAFNDIIYHYSRFLIFFQLQKGKDSQPHILQLFDSNQELILTETRKIMNTERFPEFEAEKLPAYLLHPGSLHFVFQEQCKGRRKKYGFQELKYMFLGLLQEKNLLCTRNYNYVLDYWDDVIQLVENPDGTTDIE